MDINTLFAPQLETAPRLTNAEMYSMSSQRVQNNVSPGMTYEDWCTHFSRFIGQRKVYMLVYRPCSEGVDISISIEKLWEEELNDIESLYSDFVIRSPRGGTVLPRLVHKSLPEASLSEE